MILDWLKRQEKFTLIDKRIANFFLKDDNGNTEKALALFKVRCYT